MDRDGLRYSPDDSYYGTSHPQGISKFPSLIILEK